MKAAVRGQRAHGIDGGALLAGEIRLRRRTDRAPAAPAARGIGSTVSVPSSTRPSITPALTPASFAASDLPCSRPSDSTSISRRRAGVMRCGGSPTSRTPIRTRSGPRCSPIRKRHPQHHAARRQRVVGDPVDERAQFLLQRRHVELFADVLQPVVQARIGIGVFRPHHRRPPRAGRAARRRRRRASAPCRAAPGRNRSGRARPAPAHRRRASTMRMRCWRAWNGPSENQARLGRIKLDRTATGPVAGQSKLANGKRKRCDIVRRIIGAQDKPMAKPAPRRSTDRTRLRRRRHRAADDALAVASARRAAAVAEDAGGLCPRPPAMSGLSLASIGARG